MTKQFFLIAGVIVISAAVLAGILVLQDREGSNGGGSAFTFKSAIGKKAPDFTLPDINGNQVNLASLAGKNVILFFNEGIMCYPACLDQVVELNQDSRLNNDNIVSFSIVADSAKNWLKAEKDLPYLNGAKVLFDSGAKISRIYDTLALTSSMHKGVYPGHTFYLIDKEGIVRFTLDDPYMGNRNDELAEELVKLQ